MNYKTENILRDKLWDWYKEAGKKISFEWAMNEINLLLFSRYLKVANEINKENKYDFNGG